MDQSVSLQDQEAVWITKLALVGYQLSTYESFYFIHDGEGHIKVCGQNLPSLVVETIARLTKETTQ